MKIEASLGGGSENFGSLSNDDTAANATRFTCEDGRQMFANNEGPWGDWMPEMTCPVRESLGRQLKTAVCGLETRIESRQGDGDDTGLNSMRGACCALEFI
jgi:hypothetical protein